MVIFHFWKNNGFFCGFRLHLNNKQLTNLTVFVKLSCCVSKVSTESILEIHYSKMIIFCFYLHLLYYLNKSILLDIFKKFVFLSDVSLYIFFLFYLHFTSKNVQCRSPVTFLVLFPEMGDMTPLKVFF